MGSSASYGFRRLLEATLKALPEGVEATWGTGSTPTDGLPIKARPGIPSHELAAEFAAADVVITHAGVGLSLLALAAGRCPAPSLCSVPREASTWTIIKPRWKPNSPPVRAALNARQVDDLSTEVLPDRGGDAPVVRAGSTPDSGPA